jgi:hypothetical protein
MDPPLSAMGLRRFGRARTRLNVIMGLAAFPHVPARALPRAGNAMDPP